MLKTLKWICIIFIVVSIVAAVFCVAEKEWILLIVNCLNACTFSINLVNINRSLKQEAL